MKHILVLLFTLLALSASAQSSDGGSTRLISGELIDRDTREPMMEATVSLLKTDSTFLKGALSNEKGLFGIVAPANGKYLLKISSVGYKTIYRRVIISNDHNLALGRIIVGADAIMLKGTTVTAQAQKVVVKEDTFVYNASAYRTPEGSTIEELVKRLPGAQVSDDGSITINGKTVNKIMVNGKEFMTGDTKTALKNIPTSVIEQVKAYDQKSDLARVTGIDDGEEQTVLDFGMKRGMNHGTFANVDLAAGTHDRYAGRIMGAYFNDRNRLMLFANANNTNDMGFPGGGGFGRFGAGRQGLNATKMLGLNYNYENKDHLQLDASLRWNHSDGDVWTRSAVENFVSQTGAFSNGIKQNYTRGNSWNGRLRLEWTPDSMTNIMFRPRFTYSTSDGRSSYRSASFKEDPYDYVADPLSEEGMAQLAQDSLMVNTQNRTSLTYSDQKSFGGMLQLNRRLSQNGRNVTLRTDMSYSKNGSKSLSTDATRLYLMQTAAGMDSTYQTNRYNLMPTSKWTYSLQTTYSEPIAKATYLQFGYKFAYSYSKSDRSTYDFSSLGAAFTDGINPVYRGWDDYLARLSNPLDYYLDDDLSRYSNYKTFTHQVDVMLRLVRPKYNFNVGVMIQPQRSHYVQNYMGVSVDTTRTVTNFSPTLDFRYRFSKLSNLRINYRGTTQQPSMTDLLDITDDSDPLNITKGNPGLKPAFTQNLRFFYNTYMQQQQRALMTYLNFSTTRNSISSKVSYDETTGGRTTQPENINGNWDINGAFMFNTALDSMGVWNVNTFTNANYNNYVSYLALDSHSNSVKNHTRTLTLGERIEASLRKGWVELALSGSLNYTHARNKLQSASNLDTWQFAYGPTINISFPWGMSLNSSLQENSRRGYSDNSMNTNELLWNAQLAQSFLKGGALTVSLQFYDILHNQSNFSRTISAYSRSDTEYNSINSYAMLHVIYRMNLFGSKEMRNDMRRGGDRGQGMRPMGPPPGGMGGRSGGMGGRRGGGFGGPM